MTRNIKFILGTTIFTGILLVAACTKKKTTTPPVSTTPTPYTLTIPAGLPAAVIPADNPLTVEGVALGKRLFFDPILSGNNTQACGDCHRQNYAFTDSTLQFSKGIDKLEGTRNSMPLFNLMWQKGFFWDGGASNLESQVIGPIQNPVEMHEDLANALKELNAHAEYPSLFEKAFGSKTITTAMLMKAIAQFERTLLSASSRYDQFKKGAVTLTPSESRGMALYQDPAKGDCIHCHSMGSTFSDFDYRNTGLDSIPVDKGRGRITLLPQDDGKFKTPSLRNIEYTAPYMHDGRFKTLEECIQHYNTGFRYTANLDPALAIAKKNRLTPADVQDLVAFLKTLSDPELLTNPAYKK